MSLNLNTCYYEQQQQKKKNILGLRLVTLTFHVVLGDPAEKVIPLPMTLTWPYFTCPCLNRSHLCHRCWLNVGGYRINNYE